MKLKLALQADVGDTITTEGDVGYIGKAKNKTGTSNGNDYSFWTQFVTIESDGASVGVNLAVNNESDQLKAKGEHIVIKGVLESYEKDGETKYSIGRSKLVSQSGGQAPQGSSQAAQSNGTKDRLIVTQVVYKSLCARLEGSVHEVDLSRDVDMIMRVGSNQPVEDAAPNHEPQGQDAGQDDDIPF